MVQISSRIDLTHKPFLEIDDYLIVNGDVTIGGDLTVNGDEIINMSRLLYGDEEIHEGHYLKLYDSDDSNYAGLHHDGSKLVIDLDGTKKLSIGDSEIILTPNLNINYKNIWNVKILSGCKENLPLTIQGRVTSANAGDAIKIQTRDTSNIYKDRLVITGGVDTADIKIVNALLDFNDQSIEATAGSQVGYIKIKVGGIEYKIPVYNVS